MQAADASTATQLGMTGSATVARTSVRPTAPTRVTITTATGAPPLPMTFQLSQSDTGADPATTWSLNFDDGSAVKHGIGAPPNAIAHTYQAAGLFHPSLVLANTSGSSTATATVTVQNPGPVVWLSEDIAVPAAGVTPVTFDGSESAAGAWTIDFADGSAVVSGNGVPPASLPHVSAKRGVFPVKLTVTNASGTAHAIANITPVTAYPVTSMTQRRDRDRPAHRDAQRRQLR